MFTLQDGSLTELLYESSRTLVYRGLLNGSRPVIIKILREENPSREELQRFRQEYEVTQNLKSPGLAGILELNESGSGMAIIMEDIGGQSLDLIPSERPLTVKQVLEIAVQVVNTLEQLHKKNIVHKDINPSNIVYNAQTGAVNIIDFGLASTLHHTPPRLSSPKRPEGNFSYISPEQTGRMNRSLDYRSDFYSLGATLYTLLTGQPPFVTEDRFELIHAHLAHTPQPTHELNPEVSLPLSRIIMKLLAKEPIERYQSAGGIHADLDLCLENLLKDSPDFDFIPGAKDFSKRFHLPGKLYGRDNELEILTSAFERSAAGSSEIVFLSGFPGVGKTSLVGELFRPLAAHRGTFISGKYDGAHRMIPYSAIREALRELLNQTLLAKRETLMSRIQEIKNALGRSAPPLSDFLPELKLLLDDLPQKSKKKMGENSGIFNGRLPALLRVFCNRENPLVLYLDDLQWAGLESFNLLNTFLHKVPFLLLICAFRDNEIGPGHPIPELEIQLKTQEISVTNIHLEPLSQAQTLSYVADTIGSNQEDARELAEIALQKTNGNPFFLGEFLKSLNREALLKFNLTKGYWDWNIQDIKEFRVSDNVVRFMAERLAFIPSSTVFYLSRAACLGHFFELSTLALITQTTMHDTARFLWPALEDQLLIPLSNAHKGSTVSDIHSGESFPCYYRFAHDRIEEAAYSLLNLEERVETHLLTGRLLPGTLSPAQNTERIFEIVDHLNRGVSKIQDQAERENLAQLNFQAGKKAQESIAFDTAQNYYSLGIELLTEKSWETSYESCLEFYERAMKTGFLAGTYAKMELIHENVKTRLRNISDQVPFSEIKIQALIVQNRLPEALECSRQTLEELGVRLPNPPRAPRILLKLLRLSPHLFNAKSMEVKPISSNKSIRAHNICRIMEVSIPAAYFAAPKILPFFCLEILRLSLIHGYGPYSPRSFGFLSAIILDLFGNVNTAYNLGLTGLRLARRNGPTLSLIQTGMIFYGLIAHWKISHKIVEQRLRTGYRLSREEGDPIGAGNNITIAGFFSFLNSRDLNRLDQTLKQDIKILSDLSLTNLQNMVKISAQHVLNLMENPDDPLELCGPIYDESSFLPLHEKAEDRTVLFVYYNTKVSIAFMFGRYAEALRFAELGEKYLDAARGMPQLPYFYLYRALAYLRRGNGPNSAPGSRKRNQYIKVALKNFKKWARVAPQNFKLYYFILQAEVAYRQNHVHTAREYYEEVVKTCPGKPPLQETLAWESAGKFYLTRDAEQFGFLCISNARNSYARWGAESKVKALEEEYANFFAPRKPDRRRPTAKGLVDNQFHSLDLHSIFKVYRALSTEILTEELLKKLMTVVLENTGAHSGALILNENNNLFLRARVKSQHGQVELLPLLPLDETKNPPPLAVSVANYTARTGEPVVLKDAVTDLLFQNDPYISKKRPRSLLCLPIRYQGELYGLLYLENNLTPDAFTVNHIETLRLLSSQISISLKNASYYETLQAAHKAAEKANNAKILFLKKMSHDLRTPLNNILGQSGNLIRAKKSPEDVYKYALEIQNSGTKLLAFLRNILELSSYEANKLQVNESVFYLEETISSISFHWAREAKHKGLTFTREDINSLPRLTRGDERRLDEILGNLLDNAVKFTSQGGIIFRTGFISGSFVCEIDDTGPGIPPARLKEIFKPFLLIDDGDENLPDHEGTGLTGFGLTVAKILADHLGGLVEIINRPAGGAQTRFELPLKIIEKEATILQSVQKPSENTSRSQIPAPPHELAVKVFELARTGDIQGVLDYTTELERKETTISPFITEVRRLAKGFQEKKLQEFAKKFTGS